jgi:hypothetical protein
MAKAEPASSSSRPRATSRPTRPDRSASP